VVNLGGLELIEMLEPGESLIIGRLDN
jgi:hypothetical protein